MRIQIIVAMAVGLFIAMWTGVAVGNGEYGKAAFVGVGTLFAVLLTIVGQKYRFEGWFIALIVACYFIGGKGFAYQRVGIIFVGEMTLVLLLAFHLMRCVTGQNQFVPRHPLTVPLLAFQLYGFIHLMQDRRSFSFLDVIQDTATVYYGLFFFLVFPPMLHKPTRDYVLKLLPIIAFAGLCIFSVFSFSSTAGRVIMETLMVRGNPLIYASVDTMIPVCIGFSAFSYFKSLRAQGVAKAIFLMAAILCTAPLFAYAKAVFYVAFFIYVIALVLAGHWKLMVTMIPVGVATVVLLVVAVESRVIADKERKLDLFLEEFSSFDFTGIGGATQRKSQSTVEWRLTWWKMITEDVFREAPLYGLGMGADISTEFHATYYNTGVYNTEVQIARYPHNVIFTVLGRMGIIGLVIFVPICILIARELWIGFKAIKRAGSDLDPKFAFTWAFVLAGFTNAFFQSTFEAPYTAVMFWTMLALLAVLNQAGHTQESEAPEGAKLEGDGETPFGMGRLPEPRISG